MSAVGTNDLDELVAQIFNMAFDFATTATEFARQENAELRAEVEFLRARVAELPRRGDAVETWLKQQRDEWVGVSDGQWCVLDDLLEDYRLHADTGTPLGEHACEHADCCAGGASR